MSTNGGRRSSCEANKDDWSTYCAQVGIAEESPTVLGAERMRLPAMLVPPELAVEDVVAALAGEVVLVLVIPEVLVVVKVRVAERAVRVHRRVYQVRAQGRPRNEVAVALAAVVVVPRHPECLSSADRLTNSRPLHSSQTQTSSPQSNHQLFGMALSRRRRRMTCRLAV